MRPEIGAALFSLSRIVVLALKRALIHNLAT